MRRGSESLPTGRYASWMQQVLEEFAGADIPVMLIEGYGQTHGFVGTTDIGVPLAGTKDDVRTKVERWASRGRLSRTCQVPSPVPRTDSIGRGSRCRVSSDRWR